MKRIFSLFHSTAFRFTFSFFMVWLAGSSASLFAQQPFITTWNTNNLGPSGSTSITIPTSGTGYNYDVDWNNDGTYDQFGITGNVTHNFGTAGTYTIRIRGAFPRIAFVNSTTDQYKLIDVVQWGDIAWTSMQNAFSGCTQLNISATDVPNLSGVASLRLMFFGCTNLNSPANIGTWNTSTIVDMTSMFEGASQFNQPVGGWNTGLVQFMNSMFRSAAAFNQPIGTWNTASVKNMSRMFDGAAMFDQPIGTWNTVAVTNMSYMFNNASRFNQNIGSWNTGAVTNMSNLFYGTSMFNQPLANWNTAAVTNMSGMFTYAVVFNQPIGSWNTAAVTDMSNMFNRADVFNQPLSTWSTSAVTNMSGMFAGAAQFNQPIGNWNTALVTNMSSMFVNATVFNQPLDNWNTASVTDMGLMFQNADAFNKPIGNWNTSSVTTMAQMFYLSNTFNQPLDNWDVSSVTNMNYLFAQSNSFNQSLGSWTLNPSVNINLIVNSAAGMNCINYSSTLIGWAANAATPSGRTMNAQGRQYGTSAVSARNYLVNTKGWTITNDSPNAGTCSAVLPVELLSFTGEQQEIGVLLAWRTATEQGNAGFYVERSMDGRDWNQLGFVPAQNMDGVQDYHFLDKDAPGVCSSDCSIFYRLRQMDMNGDEDISEIVRIKIVTDGSKSGIRVFPNPGSGVFYLPDFDADKSTFRILNAFGANVETAIQNGRLDLSSQPSGLYYLWVDGVVTTLVKQ
ncbi:MAG: BspA family leucine-rich repeat surface protein [Saprospiraceae bacterium]|nr:BspA family leucine-rich repeat surface protein [Saprospiraceae bacterium]